MCIFFFWIRKTVSLGPQGSPWILTKIELLPNFLKLELGTEAMTMKRGASHRTQEGLELRSRPFPLACALHADQRWFQFSLLTLFQSVFSLQKEFVRECAALNINQSRPWNNVSLCISQQSVRITTWNLCQRQDLPGTLWGSQLPHVWELSWSNWCSIPNPGWRVTCSPIIATYTKKNSSYWGNGLT